MISRLTPPQGATTVVDAIEEMRLRTWARCHYLPPELRNRDWHPVVLEEMQQKDRDRRDRDEQRRLEEAASKQETVCSI